MIKAALAAVPSLRSVPLAVLSIISDYAAPRIIILGGGEEVWTLAVGEKNWFQLAAGTDLIFVAGGMMHWRPSSSRCYSLQTCTVVAPMTCPRQGAAGVSICGRMFVFGGYGVGALSDCEVFDPTTNKWTMLPAMSTSRFDACAAEWQGRAFVIGGLNADFNSVASVECYDLELNRWSAVAAMHSDRVRAAAVGIPGHGLLVMGGRGGTSHGVPLRSAELYDSVTDQWTIMTWELPQPLYNFYAHCIHGVLYILGNLYGMPRDSWSMDFNVSQRVWVPLPPLPFTLTTVLGSIVMD